MFDLGSIYLAVTGALLLVALALGFRVLREIVRDGRDRQRRRRTGQIERDTEGEEYGRGPPADSEGDLGETRERDNSDDPAATCPQCGADNESGFSFCRRCAAPLGPDA